MIEAARLHVGADESTNEDDLQVIERAASKEISDDVGTWAVPYEEAQLTVPTHTPITSLSIDKLADIVFEVIAVEGPIHRDEVGRRVVSFWGQRLGSRISESIAAAIHFVVRKSAVRDQDGFLAKSESTAIVGVAE